MWLPVMKLIVIALYFSIITLVIQYFAVKYVPKLMKFIKRGLAQRESIRITGFRSMPRSHVRGNHFTVVTDVCIVIFVLMSMNHIQLFYVLKLAMVYILFYVFYISIFMIFTYYAIQIEMKRS